MKSFFDFSVQGMRGETDLLGGLRGKVVLAVNVASMCGYTPQYRELESLHEKLSQSGLSVVGFPCNQFGEQEPGSNAEILSFCEQNFDVTFPLSKKLCVKDIKQHRVYHFLTNSVEEFSGDVRWNFEKFLISQSGFVIGRYESARSPLDSVVLSDIGAALKAKAL